MTQENTNTETAEAIADTGNSTEETSTTVGADQEQATGADEFKDADREKLSAVVKKERAAAKTQAARAEQAEKRLAELEAGELRRNVAEEKGLSSEQAAFLTGSTEEEMSAAADALLAAFPKGGGRVRSPFEAERSGATGETAPGESMNQLADRILD